MTSLPSAPPAAPVTPLAYNPEQVAALTPFSRRAVYDLLLSGKLRGRKVSHRCWIILHTDLMAFLGADDNR